MIQVEFRVDDTSYGTRVVERVPQLNEIVAFYSNSRADVANRTLRQFRVVNVVSLFKDPTPAEDYVTFIGDEMFVVFLQDFNNMPVAEAVSAE